MAAEVPDTHGQAMPGGWKPWLRVAAVAALLLLISEALWVWQTWPVRELLQQATVPAGGGSR